MYLLTEVVYFYLPSTSMSVADPDFELSKEGDRF